MTQGLQSVPEQRQGSAAGILTEASRWSDVIARRPKAAVPGIAGRKQFLAGSESAPRLGLRPLPVLALPWVRLGRVGRECWADQLPQEGSPARVPLELCGCRARLPAFITAISQPSKPRLHPGYGPGASEADPVLPHSVFSELPCDLLEAFCGHLHTLPCTPLFQVGLGTHSFCTFLKSFFTNHVHSVKPRQSDLKPRMWEHLACCLA